jgi:hypothetical protein
MEFDNCKLSCKSYIWTSHLVHSYHNLAIALPTAHLLWCDHCLPFYAYSQFLATLACLAVTNPAYPFSVILPIQLAAFLMTMVRKGFLSCKGYHILYSISLVMPFIVVVGRSVIKGALDSDALKLLLAGFLIYRLRCMGLKKYYIWVPVVLYRVFFGDKFTKYNMYWSQQQ